MLSSIFGSRVLIVAELSIDHNPDRLTVAIGGSNRGEFAYVFKDGDDISGTAVIQLRPGKSVEHNGVKIELIGRIQTKCNRSNSEYDFFSISKDLEPAGFFNQSKTYQWKFKAADKQHETYCGINAKLRYFLRLTVSRPYNRSITKEIDLAVQNPSPPLSTRRMLKMDVGIEDCLHIEFELDSDSFALSSAMIGKVHFSVVRLKLRHMELNILRQESIGTLPSNSEGDQGLASALPSNHVLNENETIFKYELMDGTPSKDETIPVRMLLRGLNLTPTYRNIENKFSVRYFINLVLVDEDERRYFKKQEIFLYRESEM